jgi:hypothetical protein
LCGGGFTDVDGCGHGERNRGIARRGIQPVRFAFLQPCFFHFPYFIARFTLEGAGGQDESRHRSFSNQSSTPNRAGQYECE